MAASANDISLRIALDSGELDAAAPKFQSLIDLTEQWNGVLIQSNAQLDRNKSVTLRGFGEGQFDTGELLRAQTAQEEALARQRQADINLERELHQQDVNNVTAAKAEELRIQAEINQIVAQRTLMDAKASADRIAAAQQELAARLATIRAGMPESPTTEEANLVAQVQAAKQLLDAKRGEADANVKSAEASVTARNQQLTRAKLAEKQADLEIRSSKIMVDHSQKAVQDARHSVELANQELAIQQRIAAARLAKQEDVEWFSDVPTVDLLREEQIFRQRAARAADDAQKADLLAYADLLKRVRVEREVSEEKERQARAAKQISQTPPPPIPGTGTGAGGGGIPPIIPPDVVGDYEGDDYASEFRRSVEELNKELGKTGDEILPDVDKASKKAKTTWREFVIELRSAGAAAAGTSWQGWLYYLSQVGRNLTGAALAAGAFAFGITTIAGAMARMFVQGTRVEVISKAFDNLAESAGVAGDELLSKMQAVSQGTLAITDAMRYANIALMAGGEAFGKDLPALLEIARASSLATGQDIGYAFQSLITGIARGSPKLIDNANIYLKLGDANAEYAQQLGKSVTEMTAAEKQQATLNAVLRAGAGYTEKIGLESETAAEQLVSLGAAFRNLQDAISLRMAEGSVVPITINKISDALNEYNVSVRETNRLKREFIETDEEIAQLIQTQGVNFDLIDPEANALLDKQVRKRQELVKELQDAVRVRQKEMALTLSFEDMEEIETEFRERIESIRQELKKLEEERAGVLQTSLVEVWEEEFNTLSKLLSLDVEDLRKIFGSEFFVQFDVNTAEGEAAARTMVDLAQATEAYNEALASEASTAAKERGKALAGEMQRLRDLMVGFPTMPDIGKSLLTTNIEEVRAWANEAQKTIDVQKTALADQPAEMARRLAQAKVELLSQAESFATTSQRMEFYIRMAHGVAGSIDDVVESYDDLDAITQDFLLRNGLMEEAISRLRQQRGRPVGPRVVVEGVDKAISELDDFAVRLDEIGATGTAATLRGPAVEQMLNDLSNNWQRIIALDQVGFDNWIKQRLDSYDRLTQEEEAKRSELINIQEGLADLQRNIRPTPALPENVLEFNAAAFRQYLYAVASADPTLRNLTTTALENVDALERQQQAALNMAASLGGGTIALEALAREFYGAGAGVDTLIENLDRLSPTTQRIIGQMGLLSAAIAAMRAQANAPVTLGVKIEGVRETRDAIENAALRLSEVWQVEDVLAFTRKATDAATAELMRLERNQTNMSKQEYAIRRKAIEDHYTGLIDTTMRYYDQADARAKESAKQTKKSADEVRSAIEAALTRGLPVTEADMLSTRAGVYRDKAMENARRLNAIAERGFQELKAHPDWANILKIPPEVLGGTEDQLKAWAAQTSTDVQDFLRPDLINWEAFLENYQRGIDEAAARELTLDMALDKLREAGLLEPGKEEEARKRVEEMFGKPSVTFKTYFDDSTTGDKAWDAARDFLNNGVKAKIEFDVQYNTLNPPPGLPYGPPAGPTGAPGTMPTPQTTSPQTPIYLPTILQGISDQTVTSYMRILEQSLQADPAQINIVLQSPTERNIADVQTELAARLAAEPITQIAHVGYISTQVDDFRAGLELYLRDFPVVANVQLDVGESLPQWHASLNTQLATDYWLLGNVVLDTPVQDATIWHDTTEEMLQTDYWLMGSVALDTTVEDAEVWRDATNSMLELDYWLTAYARPYTGREYLDAYRSEIEGFFQNYPVFIATTLVPPEDMPYQPEWPNGENSPAENLPELRVPGMARMLPTDYMNNTTANVDMTQPGTDIANKLYSSFTTSLRAQTPGAEVATAWGVSFSAAMPLFESIGTSAGNTTADAFVKAMEKKVGRVRRRIAEMVAPEVAAILEQDDRGTLT